MHWSSDKNAGFSRAHPHGLYLPIILDPEYHYETSNVEAQERNPHSLLWWMRRALTLRKRWAVFGVGAIEFLNPDNRKVLAFIRQKGEETVLVVANLSRFPQPVALDLSRFSGLVPVELFGRTPFPVISEQSYLFTLSPHAALWFSLEKRRGVAAHAPDGTICESLAVRNDWEELLTGTGRARLESCLPGYLRKRRWFAGKTREITAVHLREAVPVDAGGVRDWLVWLAVDYLEGDPETYLLPLAFASGAEAEQVTREFPHLAVVRIRIEAANGEGLLYDACASRRFAVALLQSMAREATLTGEGGSVAFHYLGEPISPDDGSLGSLEPGLAKGEQSNTSMVYGDRFILKLFRRIEEGLNPDLEISRFLKARQFPGVPPLAGDIEYRSRNGLSSTLGLLHGWIPNSQDAWSHTLDALGRYFERVETSVISPGLPPEESLLALAGREPPVSLAPLFGTYLELARRLGQRTAELHVALASEPEDRDFAPEPFTPFYQRSLYQSMRNLAVQNLRLLRFQVASLPEPVQTEARQILAMEGLILERLRVVFETRIRTLRIRCHGDFHLGQVLYTGKDFLIIDFEGEPVRPLTERRIKRSPLRDVAGMLRSFHYAVHVAGFQQMERAPDARLRLEPWMALWYRWIGAAFLTTYLETARTASFLPREDVELRVLLESFLLDKALYELGYELNSRPEWVAIPIRGILQTITADGAREVGDRG
jgi:maltose alpha-D-glucosyltransferase/alpha-amylase